MKNIDLHENGYITFYFAFIIIFFLFLSILLKQNKPKKKISKMYEKEMTDYKKGPMKFTIQQHSHLDKCSSWGYTEKNSFNGD